jgi:DNA-binding MarR family transcriptional regulator
MGSTTAATRTLAANLRPSILRLSRHLRRDANRSGGGGSSVDVQILQALKDNIGTTVAELAAAEQITRPCMSEHIKRLVLQGYVKRADPNQQRIGSPVTLRITRRGRMYLQGVEKRRGDWLTVRLSQLSATERSALNKASRSLQLILDGVSDSPRTIAR